MKTLASTALTLICLFVLAACQQAPTQSQDAMEMNAMADATSSMEGVFEYVGTLRGQSIITEGRYVFLYGSSDEDASMTGDAGTYQLSGDTVKYTVTYSTNPDRIGVNFMAMSDFISGDTVAYVVLNKAGEITGRGRAVKRH